jgi:hypothetical protein
MRPTTAIFLGEGIATTISPEAGMVPVSAVMFT